MAVRRTIAPVNRGDPLFIGARDEITAAVYTLFSQRFSSLLANKVASRVNRDLSIKGQLSRETIAEVIDTIDVMEWRPLLIVARRNLEKAAREAVRRSLWRIGIEESDPVAMPAMAEATRWAEQRALDLIGAREKDGKLVADKDAEASIAKTTQEMLEGSLESIADKDIPVSDAIASIGEAYALSAQRAELIGKTEVDSAISKGELFAFGHSGMVSGVKWVTKRDNRVEIHCLENERAGVLPMGTKFPSGHEHPPAHPRCRCALAAVTA